MLFHPAVKEYCAGGLKSKNGLQAAGVRMLYAGLNGI